MRLGISGMFAAGIALSACGGGGSEVNPSTGAIQRENPSLNFPLDGLGSGDIEIRRAFPGLSFSAPLVITRAPGDDTRLYVATQGGQVFAFDGTREGTTSLSLYLDIRDRTRASGEQGLLGMAFDPEYPSNGYVYLYYNANLPTPIPDVGDSVVARFRADSGTGTADPASEQVLLQFAQDFQNHNGGAIEFGPDGMLYIASGDGGSGNDPNNRAQDLSSLLGKILRIAPDGSIPPDNPFIDGAAARPEIWAYGLRNPFRISFDPSTGRLWAGDVGQGAQEEIDIIDRAGNYGWRVYEGTRCNTSVPNRCATQDDPAAQGFIEPIHSYDRAQGRSVTGGRVYRGDAIPLLFGRYVYGDFVSGTIWALSESAGRAVENRIIGSVANPSSFGFDLDGELLITAYDGSLRRITPRSAPGGGVNAAPRRLSDTGLFADLASLTPGPGVVEYRPAAEFWSDGAQKRRWIALPGNTRIQFSASAHWQFPIGTVTVKHFEMRLADGQLRRLETRVFVHHGDGWRGYTYRWLDDQRDAELLDSGEQIDLAVDDGRGGSRLQTYTIPRPQDCGQCHTSIAGEVLGIRTAQLNHAIRYANGISANQLQALDAAGYFDTSIPPLANLPALENPADPRGPVAQRARAYLETNCSHCHQPGGPSPDDMDLRAATPMAQTRTLQVTASGAPVGGATHRIVPGSKETSLIWTRINTRVPSEQMPPLASHLIDAAGLELIGLWIDQGAN